MGICSKKPCSCRIQRCKDIHPQSSSFLDPWYTKIELKFIQKSSSKGLWNEYLDRISGAYLVPVTVILAISISGSRNGVCELRYPISASSGACIRILCTINSVTGIFSAERSQSPFNFSGRSVVGDCRIFYSSYTLGKWNYVFQNPDHYQNKYSGYKNTQHKCRSFLLLQKCCHD